MLPRPDGSYLACDKSQSPPPWKPHLMPLPSFLRVTTCSAYPPEDASANSRKLLGARRSATRPLLPVAGARFSSRTQAATGFWTRPTLRCPLTITRRLSPTPIDPTTQNNLRVRTTSNLFPSGPIHLARYYVTQPPLILAIPQTSKISGSR